MMNEELVRALNQIHLEAGIIETLLCQYRVTADEANIKILTGALSEIHQEMNFDDFSEQWCLEDLGSLCNDYIGLCREICLSPVVMTSNPPIFVAAFNVLLRCSYKYLSDQRTELLMTETAKMMAAADEYLTDETFVKFIYWFDALNFDEPWNEAAKIPRIIRMAEEENEEMLQRLLQEHIAAGGNRGRFPEA